LTAWTMNGMSRGEMIRRLDEASEDVRVRLASGSLATEERLALATRLSRQLAIVADSLQAQADADAATALTRHVDPIAASRNAGRTRARCRSGSR
jgi:hypothetical protein